MHLLEPTEIYKSRGHTSSTTHGMLMERILGFGWTAGDANPTKIS